MYSRATWGAAAKCGLKSPDTYWVLITTHVLEYLSVLFIRCLQNLELLYSEGLKEMKLTLFPFPMSEDCLYLNIYTPAHAHEGSNLPVSIRPWSALAEGILSRWLEGGKKKAEFHYSVDPDESPTFLGSKKAISGTQCRWNLGYGTQQ